MRTLHENLKELNKTNTQVVVISVNDPFTNKAFAQNNNLNFPILSDYNKEVVKLYYVYHENFGNLKGYTAAKRAVFILDHNGVVVYKWVSDDPGKEPNYEELKKAAAKTT